jgi:hypothetical protein
VLPAGDGVSALDTASAQVEVIRAARACGIPTAAVIGNVETLTNAALIQAGPDIAFAWDQAQRDEALSLFGASPDRVIVTGAPFEPSPQPQNQAASALADRVALLLETQHAKPARVAVLDLVLRPFLLATATVISAGSWIERSAAMERAQREIRSMDHRLRKWGPKALRVTGKNANRWGKKIVRLVRVARYRAAMLFRS